MNGWFLSNGLLLAAALCVHVRRGYRLYEAARPDPATTSDEARTAWLMGRCGMRMISADLFLAAVWFLLAGWGVVPCNPWPEALLLLVFTGWSAGWLRSLAVVDDGRRHLFRLGHWALFAAMALLTLCGMVC